MNVIIRQERPADYKEVENVIYRAFEHAEYSDKTEHVLVARLRNSSAFIPELSLVACMKDNIVGHILLTKIEIINDTLKYDSLALAPVSVLPGFQKKGIGAALVNKSHEIAKSMGYCSITLIGHAEYYPRFGYKLANEYNIDFQFEAPPENCMIIEIQSGCLKNVSGQATYPKEFFE